MTLIGANAIAFGAYVFGGGSILEVLWIYWLQSVIIGIVNFRRIMNTHLKGGLKINGATLISDPGDYAPTKLGNFMVAMFFAFHYGIFHLVYMFFLFSFSLDFQSYISTLGANEAMINTSVNIFVVALCALVFWLHHNFSYIAERQYVARHTEAAPTLSEIMKRPYYRIFPMHIIIVLGPFLAAIMGAIYLLPAFIILKTIADVKLFQASTRKFAQ